MIAPLSRKNAKELWLLSARLFFVVFQSDRKGSIEKSGGSENSHVDISDRGWHLKVILIPLTLKNNN